LGIAVIEYHPVEHTVDDVSDGTAEDKPERKNHSGRGFLLDEVSQVPGDADNGYQPEYAQNGFTPFTAPEFHPESHSVVLDKVDLEPVPEDTEFIPDHHVRLDPDLHDLVDN
jgi:hypothetical protein